ncbi:MAG: Mrp/NBP35 family ATP-binding protein [Candidatus Omnitrophica bacterium]|nr:Mrp/NBP35 family ATP-binding protein [Candidatus Omnitrophota bacterium]
MFGSNTQSKRSFILSQQPPQPQVQGEAGLNFDHIKRSIAVASGKGGVGKSTCSVNLSVALAEMGAKVGLMDGDIYGPNVPMMMGVRAAPEVVEGKLKPVEKYGVKMISMAFFLEEDQPVVWRGPMIHGAIRQFLADVDWGELDYLLVDLPPGTGDAQLSLSQTIPLTGAVVVTTPQGVSLADAKKAKVMFDKVSVPVLGVIENMSYFTIPGTGERHEIFSSGGGKKFAEEYGVGFLGDIPLYIGVREGGDEGNPIVLREPDSEPAQAFKAAAKSLMEICDSLGGDGPKKETVYF